VGDNSEFAGAWRTLKPFRTIYTPNPHSYYQGPYAQALKDHQGIMGSYSNARLGMWEHHAVTMSVPDASGFRTAKYYINGQLVAEEGAQTNSGLVNDGGNEPLIWIPSFFNAGAQFFSETAATDGSEQPVEWNSGVHRMTLWSEELLWDDISREYNAGYGADPRGGNSYHEQNVAVDWLFDPQHAVFDYDASAAYLIPKYNNLGKWDMIEGDVPWGDSTYGAGAYLRLDSGDLNYKDWDMKFINRTTRNSQGHPFKLYKLAHLNGGYEPEFKLFAKKVFGPGGVQMPTDANYDDIITFSWTLNL
jgi:hypothetical protein